MSWYSPDHLKSCMFIIFDGSLMVSFDYISTLYARPSSCSAQEQIAKAIEIEYSHKRRKTCKVMGDLPIRCTLIITRS